MVDGYSSSMSLMVVKKLARSEKSVAIGGLAVVIATGLGLLAAAAQAAPPSLSLAATDATVGQTIHAAAQLSESPGASGGISFEVFAPDDPTCSGPELTPAPASATVNGEGEYVSGEFTPETAGTYHWSAHYSGDGENPPADSDCSGISTVGKASPGLTGNASAGAVGTAIHDEGTVSEGFSPTGEVTFSVYGPTDTGCSTPLQTTTVPIQSSHATSPDFSPQQAGEYRWTATYPGDADNEAASTVCGATNQTSAVSKAVPALSGVATSAVTVGQTIDDSAALSGGFSASGQLVFRAYGPGDATCANAPKYEEAVPVSGNDSYSPAGFAPGAGSYRWTVEYGGDANNEPASTACGAANQTSSVSKAVPTLSGVATSAVTVGSPITDNATLAGGFSAGGQLVFRAYGPGDATCADAPKYEEAVPVSGNDSYAPAGFAPGPGSYRWTVEYGGDGNNQSASTVCGAANQTSTVSKASPTLSGTATSAVTVGLPITDSATLAGGFSAGGQLVFRAYGPSDATCVNPPEYEETVAVNGDGSYSPAGFAPAPGVYRWTVEYGGDANNEAVSTACGAANQSSTVSKASPTLAGVATSAVTVGSPITDNATLAGGFSAGGQLVFRAYGPGDATCANAPKYQEAVPVNGNGSYSPAGFSPGPGSYRWTVEYGGDGNNQSASTVCGAANQTSTVNKASPTLEGVATSVVTVGSPITDNATLAGGFSAGGELVFRAYGPGDQTCATTPKYEATVPVNGDGPYSPAGFAPAPGLYRWTVEYAGDANNEAAGTACGAANQASAVGVVSVTFTVSATGGTVGNPVNAAATIQEGAIPAGQITFKAFPPSDVNCSGAAAFSSVVSVSGNGSYRSAAFVPSRVGAFRWTVGYSGDVNHAPATAGCGKAASSVSQATPSVSGAVGQRLTVGTAFRDTTTLQGGYTPAGTITFRIYGPVAAGCATPVFVDTVAVAGNGTFSSDPFVAKRAGRYSFVASYSGDASNRGAIEPCDSVGQVARVQKRTPKVKPRALLIGARQISIRAHLSGGASPSGVINFRLYGPGDKRCKRKPAFSGAVTVKSNGNYSLATYLATKAGIYRLSVGYSGDQRNKRYKGSCSGAQPIRVG
jgi:hypothetical protein